MAAKFSSAIARFTII